MAAFDATSRGGLRAARWDIFCRVVDNLGDIGVCWRLARQCANEYGHDIRLWVDDLATFARLCPTLSTSAQTQIIEGVEVCLWDTDAGVPTKGTPADVVIEGFGCGLQVSAAATDPQQGARQVWINLEYLSAESWVEECHRLPSIQRETGRVRHFFFPGFTARTGGLLRERGLAERREAFLSSADAIAAFWQQIGVSVAAADTRVASLFAYETARVGTWLDELALSQQKWLVLVPETVLTSTLEARLPREPGASATFGNVTLMRIPFLTHADYDRLLWLCDLNFVRGEDSLVRAIWAGRPFVWNIYVQDEDVHGQKLMAFLARYLVSAEPLLAKVLSRFWLQWNRLDESGTLARPDGSRWDALWAEREAWRAHALQWSAAQVELPDLAANLHEFVAQSALNLLK